MNRYVSVLLLALAAAVPAVAKEEQPLPKDLPPYGADKPLPVPEIAQRTLKNGLTVWVVPREGLPKVNAVLAVRGGTAHDPPERPGTAQLFAGLLTEGTATRSSRQIAEEMQGLGGTLGAGAGSDGVTLYGDAFVSKTPELLALVADVARHAAFPENEVVLAKANALQGLKAQESTPGFLAERAFVRTVYGEHPYARTAQTEAGIAAITPEILRATHRERFRPDRALLVVAGPVTARQVFAAVERAFGGWRAEGPAPADTPPVADAGAPRRVLVERAGSVQSSLRIGSVGVPATHPDAIPLALTNTILGGGFTSRITQNIREDKGYTYSPFAQARRARAGGAVLAAAEVRNEVTAAALNEMLYEFDRIGTTPVGDDELARAKRFFAGIYLFQNQQQGAVVATLANNWLVGLPPEYLGSYVPKAQAVSAEDVRRVARTYYASRRQHLVIVGDRSAIADELAQYGAFETFTP